jgi:hypothetical protein
MRPRDPGVELGLVVGLSLGVVTVCAQSMLWLQSWQPESFVYALAGACLLLLAAAVALSAQREGHEVDCAPTAAPGTEVD